MERRGKKKEKREVKRKTNSFDHHSHCSANTKDRDFVATQAESQRLPLACHDLISSVTPTTVVYSRASNPSKSPGLKKVRGSGRSLKGQASFVPG